MLLLVGVFFVLCCFVCVGLLCLCFMVFCVFVVFFSKFVRFVMFVNVIVEGVCVVEGVDVCVLCV